MSYLPPKPTQFSSLLDAYRWADSLTSYLINKLRTRSEPIYLYQITDSSTVSAAQSGILIYSTSLGMPLISKSGVWERVYTESDLETEYLKKSSVSAMIDSLETSGVLTAQQAQDAKVAAGVDT